MRGNSYRKFQLLRKRRKVGCHGMFQNSFFFFMSFLATLFDLLLLFGRYSQFQDEYSLEEILNSPKVTGPLTKLQCCPTSDGAGAAILASEEFVITHGLQNQAVEILAMEMTTDFQSTFTDQSPMKIVSHRRYINSMYSHFVFYINFCM